MIRVWMMRKRARRVTIGTYRAGGSATTRKGSRHPQQAISAVGVSLLSSDARNGWRKPPAAGGLCFIE